MRLPFRIISRKRINEIEASIEQLKTSTRTNHCSVIELLHHKHNTKILLEGLGKRVDKLHFHVDDQRERLRKAINCRLYK